MNLSVLYEDEFFLALNKKANCHCIKQEGDTEPSVASLLIDRDSGFAQASESPHDGGLVHRLDYGSSGVLLAAKAREVWDHLRVQFQKRSIEKEYESLLEGAMIKDTHIENYIGSPYRRAKKVRVYEQEPSKKARALPAESSFFPIEQYDELASRVNVRILTGCRHQIRAHASHLGHPLVGDELYGSSLAQDQLPAHLQLILEGRDFYLHAKRLVFLHPHTNQRTEITA